MVGQKQNGVSEAKEFDKKKAKMNILQIISQQKC